MLRRAWLLLFALPACSPEEEVAPVPVDTAVHYTMSTTIPAGQEAEHCKFVRAPPEGLLINHDEVRYTAGSHHLLLFKTRYEEIPTKTDGGQPIPYVDEAQGVFDCTAGVLFDFGATQIVAGSQNADGASVVDFPPGVALRVEPNEILLLNAHYINATGDDLHPEIDVALHTIAESELQAEGEVLFFYDIFVKAAQMTTSWAAMKCEIAEDITLTNAQSHMHARGVGFQATLLADGQSDVFYESDTWENVPVEHFDGGLAIKAGSTIEQRCEYDNGEARDVYQGQTSTDEMCVLIGSYYPATPHVGLCAGIDDKPLDTFGMGAEWQGQGTETCAASLGCFNTAIGEGMGIFGILNLVTECVLASDPAIAPELSAAIGCTFSVFRTGGDPFADCADQIDACAAK
jgi:copper type II ascorbate-dependent monooxygenase-like protein